MHADASDEIEHIIGIPLEKSDNLEKTFDILFEQLWAGTSNADARQRALYKNDALAVIRAINLRLITTPDQG